MYPLLAVLAGALAVTLGPAWAAQPRVLSPRTARWEHEVNLESQGERFGAEHNPTGSPIGGGPGYSDIVTEGRYTVRTYDELRQALAKAAAGEVVFVPGDAAIDMGGNAPLSIPGRVTLASDRGLDGSLGGQIVSNLLDTGRGMLMSAGDEVRITGLRIRGPYPDIAAIPKHSSGVLMRHFACEIDNCEVSGFAISAIRFNGPASRGYAHHNYIHHNRRSGYGYGISVYGADALIEANIFDACRHHIASAGAPGDAYEARYDLSRLESTSHLFDMHGGGDRGDGSSVAGDWLNVHHNTFMCLKRSVVIRGVPSAGARVHHNWFYNPDPNNAVRTQGSTLTTRNVFGPDRTLVETVEH